MIYVLLGIAVFAALVWAGRRARPFLLKRELRIVTATVGMAVAVAGGFAALRGGYLVGGVLGAIGLGLIFSGRSGLAKEAPDAPPPDAAVAEAREILGVGPRATREEVQAAYARLIRAVHPDVGGSAGLAARLNAARDTLLKR